MSNRKKQTARHDGRIVDAGSSDVNGKTEDRKFSFPTLFEVWFGIRGFSLPAIAENADLAAPTVYGLLSDPDASRDSTLSAIASLMGKRFTAAHVRALAMRKVRRHDRVSDEIEAVLDEVDRRVAV